MIASNDGKETQNREILHQTALKAPSSSGVYLWRNKNGTVLYVGKAKNLKNRLTSYFSGAKDIKTMLLIKAASSIEYITTENEYEAFLLENNLIKKYTPKYNIQLKDGKSYPSLKITDEDFPRIYKTRNIKKDGSLYFGPFPDSGSLDSFIETLHRIYPLRHCKKFRKKEIPCMYYHIGSCKAPCCSKISKNTYIEFIGEIKGLLEENSGGDGTAVSASHDGTVGGGGTTGAFEKIETAMKEAAKSLNFEKAARLRDGLKALNILQHQNVVEDFDENDRDYIAYSREGELVSFTVLKVRGGKLLDRENYRTISISDEDELLENFAFAYYTDISKIPPAIYVGTKLSFEFLQKYFEETLHATTNLVLVSASHDLTVGGEHTARHRAALDMAYHNAREDLIRRQRERGDEPAMIELQKLLHLKKKPERIEGFDIAHIGGKFPVASLISFYKGNPDKKNYRYFRLKTTSGVIDDFASMREATSRRYSRLLNEDSPLPDLILIDGGIGQVNAVDAVLRALDLEIPIAGLAKRDEEIWLPHAKEPICLPKRSDGLRLLQRVRDETHRFATSRNQNLRTKENTVSVFSKLPHVGKVREKMLIEKFTTLEVLCQSSKENLAQVLKIPELDAEEILTYAENELKMRQEKSTTVTLLQQGSTKVESVTADTFYEKYISSVADEILDDEF